MKINKYNINDDLIDEYISVLNRIATKGNVFSRIEYLEKRRRETHEAIFKSIKLDRHSLKGQEFSKELDKAILPYINDELIKDLKILSGASTQEELQNEADKLMFKRKLQERMSGHNTIEKVYSKNCRVCKVDLPEGTPRYNDHLSGLDGVPDEPICMKCADECPDEFHKRFKRAL